MALIIANRITLHGNAQIKDLERQIYERFYQDSIKNGEDRDSTGIKRILFGLSDKDEFNWKEKTGSDWAYFQKRDGNSIIFISAYPALTKLQEYIALYAEKIDPDMVVQLDYEDLSGVVIGTRIAIALDENEIEIFEEEEYTPDAQDKELPRSLMNKIKDSQRRDLKEQLINLVGSSYNYLKLAKWAN